MKMPWGWCGRSERIKMPNNEKIKEIYQGQGQGQIYVGELKAERVEDRTLKEKLGKE